MNLRQRRSRGIREDREDFIRSINDLEIAEHIAYDNSVDDRIIDYQYLSRHMMCPLRLTFRIHIKDREAAFSCFITINILLYLSAILNCRSFIIIKCSMKHIGSRSTGDQLRGGTPGMTQSGRVFEDFRSFVDRLIAQQLFRSLKILTG